MMKRHPAEGACAVESGKDAGSRFVRVWDLFVRIFHWSLVIAFATAWYTGGIWNRPHLAAGYLVLALILARIIWGFVGSLTIAQCLLIQGRSCSSV